MVANPPTEAEGSLGLWSYVQSLWGRFWATSATKQPYKIMAGAVVAILVLMILGAAASSTSSTVNQDIAIKSTPTPSVSVIKTTPSPTATIKPTATPTPAAKPTSAPVDYSAQISANYGENLVTPFYKTTVNGKEAYVGDVYSNNHVIRVTMYPTKTENDAYNYKEQLIQSYKVQGYGTYDEDADMWQGVLGTNMHGIGALYTNWGFWATMDQSGNFHY